MLWGCSARFWRHVCFRGVLPGGTLASRVGLPVYTAPEVVIGKYTVAADIWSCGIMMSRACGSGVLVRFGVTYCSI